MNILHEHMKQSTNTDCGVACIYMILHSVNNRVSYHNLKSYFHISSKGISLKEIKDFFESLGTKITIFKIDNILKCGISTFNKKQFPCIGVEILPNSNHYIVIYSINNGYITYSDPMYNTIKRDKIISFMDKLHFMVLIDSIKNIKIPKKYLSSSKHGIIFYSLRQQWKNILKITFYSIILSCISILISTQLGQFIDLVIPTKNTYNIITFGIIYGIALLMYIALYYFHRNLTIDVFKNIENYMNTEICNNIFYQLYDDFSDYKTGDIASRINDSMSISMMVANFLMNILSNILMIIVAFITLINININLTFILFILLIINLIVIKTTYSKIFDKNYKTMETHSNYYAILVESINDYKDIKTTNSEKFYLNKMNNKLIDYIENSKKKELYSASVSSFQLFLSMFISLIIICTGSHYVIIDKISIGNLSIFVSISGILQNVTSSLVQFQFQLESFKISLNRIKQIFNDSSTQIDNNIKYVLKDKIKKINLKNFSIYQDDIIIKNSSLELNSSNIFIHGKSGSGKSSFAKILAGLKNNYTGDIYINDQRIDEIPIQEIKQKIIYVSNDISIFEGSIRENLCLGKKY